MSFKELKTPCGILHKGWILKSVSRCGTAIGCQFTCNYPLPKAAVIESDCACCENDPILFGKARERVNKYLREDGGVK